MTIKTVGLKIPILPPNSPQASQPIGLKVPLHPHQLRALHRCLLIESDGSLSGEFNDGYDYKSRGGALADAVGMGKTATSIGMVLSGQKGNGGDTLVVAPGHLIPQWKNEIHKFSNDIQVIVGKEEYDKITARAASGKQRIVLISVDSILNEDKLWYNFRRVYSKPKGGLVKVHPQLMEEYKKAALFCVKSPKGPCSYDGWVYTGTLHIPPKSRPWRRVIFDEIQDLVAEGTESQKNLLQLTRSAQNVWLLSATPFPHGNQSVYANHELLGFCRLRMDVEVDYPLARNHTFEVIKRKLYIRSPRDVADQAVTATKKVTKMTVAVNPSSLETNFYSLEAADIMPQDRGKVFSNAYDSLRQMMVHPEASKKLREQIHGKKKPNDQSKGRSAPAAPQVGRYNSVNSFARSSLAQARTRLRKIDIEEFPAAQKQLIMTRVSKMLAIKIRQLRASPRHHNPFQNVNSTIVSVVPMETDEATAIHEYYCRCSSLGSAKCMANFDAAFRILNPETSNSEFISGINATSRIIQYFQNELAQDKLVGAYQVNALEHYIQVTDHTYTMRLKAIGELGVERSTLQKRIGSLSATVTANSLQPKEEESKEDKLAAAHGSKTAALILHLSKIQESGERGIVFSYWHDTLSLVWRSLKKYNLRSSFCNGDSRAMSKAINDFTSGSTSILLLSSQAKASGANLQCASHVVLLDPTGSSAEHGAALEQQAIGRAVRMGQEKAVTVTRFCVMGTIEEGLFEQIDDAATKLEKRSNDSSYVCEDAWKELKSEPAVEEEDDDVLVTEAITSLERVARIIAIAKEQGEVIEILDDDDDDDDGNNESSSPKSETSASTDTSRISTNISVKKEVVVSTSHTNCTTISKDLLSEKNANPCEGEGSRKRTVAPAEENSSAEKRPKNADILTIAAPEDQLTVPTPTKASHISSRVVSPPHLTQMPRDTEGSETYEI
jgi:hypothetical protein